MQIYGLLCLLVVFFTLLKMFWTQGLFDLCFVLVELLFFLIYLLFSIFVCGFYCYFYYFS
jgi:hypothetical protein